MVIKGRVVRWWVMIRLQRHGGRLVRLQTSGTSGTLTGVLAHNGFLIQSRSQCVVTSCSNGAEDAMKQPRHGCALDIRTLAEDIGQQQQRRLRGDLMRLVAVPLPSRG